MLDVPPISPKMHGDTVRSGRLADGRGGGGVGFVCTSGLTNCRNVIDVDVQPLPRHERGCRGKERHVTFAPQSQEKTK